MNINYCANCGAKINEGDVFCGECGEKISLVPIEKNHCPSCGYVTIEKEKYCPECGAALTLGNEVEKKPKSQSKTAEKKKSRPAAKTTITPPVKKKNGGMLRILGKVALWVFGLLIVAVVGLYFLGDSPDENNTTELKTETPIKVREANPVLTNKVSFPIMSSSKVQVFNYGDSIKISLPPDFTSKNQKLFVSKAKVDPSIMVEDAEPLMMVDLTLYDGEQPAKSLEISYTYNKVDLNPNFTAEEQLTAFRWDEEGGGWVNLPIRIDEKKNEVSVLTNHLSIFTIGLAVVGIIKTAKAYVDYKDSKKLTGIYVTPQKNFRILYSKQEINKDVYLKDKKWRRTYSSPDIKYSSKHPLFIQDMGGILEQTLNRYTNSLFPEFTYGFRTPTGEFRNAYFGTFHKMLTVKMDSYLQEFTWPKDLSDPFYEKLQERLYIPTTKCIGGKTAKLTLAHELFHAVQAQYYGRLGMYDSGNQWWLEATAEYAAYEVAWPKPLTGIGDAGGSNYLTFPVISRGTKKGHGWSRDYEYASAIWIKYLVDIEQYDFEDMIEYDASDNLPSINSLEKYSSKTIKLDDVYRDFANWMVFSKNGGLNKHPIATFDSGNNSEDLIAVNRSKLNLGSGKEINYSFDMPNWYSSKTWAIKLIDKSTTKKKGKKPIIIEVKDKSPGIRLDVFVLPEGKRFLDPPKPSKTIFVKDKPVLLLVSNNDILYISATIGGLSGKADIVVKDAGITLEIDPAELKNVRAREANYFTIIAKNIPKEIEKVNFKWDYNDGSKLGINEFVAVSNGEATNKISHRYEEQKTEKVYLLKAVLIDANTGIQLADAEARIIVPLPKVDEEIKQEELNTDGIDGIVDIKDENNPEPIKEIQNQLLTISVSIEIHADTKVSKNYDGDVEIENEQTRIYFETALKPTNILNNESHSVSKNNEEEGNVQTNFFLIFEDNTKYNSLSGFSIEGLRKSTYSESYSTEGIDIPFNVEHYRHNAIRYWFYGNIDKYLTKFNYEILGDKFSSRVLDLNNPGEYQSIEIILTFLEDETGYVQSPDLMN